MKQYGPSPFAWTWRKDGYGEGDFRYDASLSKNYRLFFCEGPAPETAGATFCFEGSDMCLVLKTVDVSELVKSGKLIPALGSAVACPVDKFHGLVEVAAKAGARMSISPPRRRNLDVDRALVEAWMGRRMDDRPIKIKCMFHDDRNPSAVYNPKTGHYKCFGCGVRCFALKKMLTKAVPEKLAALERK